MLKYTSNCKNGCFFLLLYWHLGVDLSLFFSYFFENPLGLEGIIPKSFIESSFLSSTNHGFLGCASPAGRAAT
jgi:hypothetical protein